MGFGTETFILIVGCKARHLGFSMLQQSAAQDASKTIARFQVWGQLQYSASSLEKHDTRQHHEPRGFFQERSLLPAEVGLPATWSSTPRDHVGALEPPLQITAHC